MTAHLAVYLIHYKAPEWGMSAASSLARSADVDLDVMVVDNSDDFPDSPDVTRVIRTGSNCGFTGGANVALQDWWDRFPDDDYVVIGSHDLHVEHNTLSILLNTAHENPEYGVLGPLLEVGGVGLELVDEPTRGKIDRRSWVSGTCLLLTRGCLSEIGGFDEAFGSYVEDVEFCLRAQDVGFKVGRVPQAKATGLGSSSPRAQDFILANEVVLNFRRRGIPGVLTGMAGFLAIAAKALVRGVITRDVREKAWRRARRHLFAAARAPERLMTVRRLGGAAVPMFQNTSNDIDSA